MEIPTHVGRNYRIRRYSCDRTITVKSAAYASFGDISEDSNAVFPRIHIKDPYKWLGISSESSEEEIQAARNFLINKYAGHKPSVDAIEYAYDKIIMQNFFERKNPKINLKKKVREVTQSRVYQGSDKYISNSSNKCDYKDSNHICGTRNTHCSVFNRRRANTPSGNFSYNIHIFHI